MLLLLLQPLQQIKIRFICYYPELAIAAEKGILKVLRNSTQFAFTYAGLAMMPSVDMPHLKISSLVV